MAVFEWTEETPVTANNLNAMQEQNQDEVDNKIAKIGKTLWEGSFSSGSITIPGLSDYTYIIVMLSSVACFGTLTRGFGGMVAYGGYTIQHFAYRVKVSGNTMTIDNNERGGSSGSANEPITKIIGLF